MTQLGTAVLKLTTDNSGIDKGFADVQSKARGLGGVMQTALGTAAGFAAAQVGMQGLSGAFDFLVGNAANFEQSLSAVSASTGATTAEMKLLREEALLVGKDTSKTASEAVLAFGELAKAGMSVETILAGAGRSAVQLAEATGVSVPAAAVLMSSAMNVFKADGKSAAEVADQFAKTAVASAIGVEDLGQALASGGAQAVASGLSMEEFSNVIAIMGNNGVKGAEAGTGLKSMLNGLTPTTDKAKKAMAAMGFSAFDATGNMKDLRTIIAEYGEATKDMTQEQKLMTGEIIFGSYGVNTMNTLVREGARGWDSMTEAIGKAPTVASQSEKRLQGMNGQLEKLRGSLETVSIQLGTLFLPAITAVLLLLTNALNYVVPGVTGAFKLLGAVIKFLTSDDGGLPLLILKTAALIALFGPFGAAILLVWSRFDAIKTAVGELARLFSLGLKGGKIGGELNIIERAAFALGVLFRDTLIPFWNNLIEAIRLGALILGGGEVGGSFTALQQFVIDTAYWIRNAWETVIKPALEAFGKAIVWLYGVARDNWPLISGIVTTLYDVMRTNFAFMVGVVETLGPPMIAVAEAAWRWFGDVVAAIKWAVDTAKPYVDKLVGWLDVASKALGGIQGGVRAAAGIVGIGGGRAEGGPVSAGSPYIVGEQGWEMFVPSQRGTILSHEDSMAAAGGGSLAVNFNINGENIWAELHSAVEELRRRVGSRDAALLAGASISSGIG